MKLAAEVLAKVPKPIDLEGLSKNIGENKKPLDVVLLQEVNNLTTYNKT